MPSITSVAELSKKLSERAEEVCERLLPSGRRNGDKWCVGDVTGEAGKSLQVALEGDFVGEWRDWSTDDQKGDLVDLWAKVRALDPISTIRECKKFLGIDTNVYEYTPKVYAVPPVEVTRPLQAGGGAMKWLNVNRGLDLGIINRFRLEGYENTDTKVRALVFPTYSPSGKIVNRSYRTLTKPKSVWQEKGCAPSLFGWQALDPHAIKEGAVLICEGQIDAMTWTQWSVPALSIPNGSGATWIEYEWDNLEAFDRIYLSFDQDGAGAANLEKVMQRLGKHRCSIVELPHKDANECLMAGCTKTDVAIWISSAKSPTIKSLLTAVDLKQRIIHECEYRPAPWTLPFFRGADKEGRDGYYPRTGEVTIWSGPQGSGKSTLLNYFMLSLLKCNQPVFVCSLEMKIETLVMKMMMAENKRRPTEIDIDAFITDCGKDMICGDIVGYVGEEELIDMLRFSHQKYGITHAFIDSLMCIDKLEEDYKAQGEFVNKLARIAITTGIHVHLVAHPKKKGEDTGIDAQDVKGSSIIANRADNVLFVGRNRRKDQIREEEGGLTREQSDSMYDTRVTVKKQRMTGWQGTFYLKFDPHYFAYSAIKFDQNLQKQREDGGKIKYKMGGPKTFKQSEMI